MQEWWGNQVETIKGIKIDKVTVWDNAGSGNVTNTANFLSGMMKSVPPLKELFNMAGLDLPDYLAKDKSPKKELTEVNEQAPIENEN